MKNILDIDNLKIDKIDFNTIPNFWKSNFKQYKKFYKKALKNKATDIELFWLHIYKAVVDIDENILVKIKNEFDGIDEGLKYQALGFAWFCLDNKDLALDYLHKAVEVDPNLQNLKALRMLIDNNFIKEMKEICFKIIEISPYEFVANFFLCRYYLKKNNLDKMYVHVDRLLKSHRYSHGTYYMYGDYLYANKNWEKAIKQYKRSIKLGNKRDTIFEIHELIAECYMELEDWKKANKHAHKALACSPESVAGELLEEINQHIK